MVESKLFNFPLLKKAVQVIGTLRESIVFDQNFEAEQNVKDENATLFHKLGGIDGLTKILDYVFKMIQDDAVLSAFY